MKLRGKGKYTSQVNEQILAAPPDELLEVKEKEKVLNEMTQALNELNEEQKVCVTLFYLEKKSYMQVAEITGYSLMQVKSNIQNGKRNLKIQMERSLKNE